MLDQDFIYCRLLASKLHSIILFSLGRSFEKDEVPGKFSYSFKNLECSQIAQQSIMTVFIRTSSVSRCQ